MASIVRSLSRFSTNLTPTSTKRTTDISVLQFVRCNSLFAHKLIYSEYGDPAKVVRKEEETLSPPQPNQVVVRMLASPCNPADINTIQGVYPVKPPLPSIPGNEGVGEIECVGSAVTGLSVGDRVVPTHSAWGTWRSRAVCLAKEMTKISKAVGVVEAATLTVNPCTAYRMLRDFVPLQTGDTVIQNGANSACGQSVIQMCRAWGVNTVNVVRNRDDVDQLKSFLQDLGATHVLTEEELRTTDIFKSCAVSKPRLALNCVGGKNALEVLRQLAPGGVMVTYGGMSRDPVTAPTSALIFKDLSLRGFWMTRWSKEHVDSPLRAEMLEEIVQMMMCGQLKAPRHKMVPFSAYREALANTMSKQGFAGVKYILDFQAEGSC